MTRGKRDPKVRAEIIAALKGGMMVPEAVAAFSGRASRATIFRIAEEIAPAAALPVKPPGSPEDLRALVGILGWPGAAEQDQRRLQAIIHNVAEKTLAMARADKRDGASTAETLRALRRVADLAAKMEGAIAAVPDLMRPVLLRLLQHDSAWDSRHFGRNVARVITMVQEDAQASGAAGPGTLRKRILGDAFDYLGGEALSLWKTFRRADAANLDAGGPFGEFVAQLWHYATGRGADGMPYLKDRVARLRAAEAIRDEARRHEDEARRRTAAGVPAQPIEAAADAAHALAQRVARGRAPKASHKLTEKT